MEEITTGRKRNDNIKQLRLRRCLHYSKEMLPVPLRESCLAIFGLCYKAFEVPQYCPAAAGCWSREAAMTGVRRWRRCCQRTPMAPTNTSGPWRRRVWKKWTKLYLGILCVQRHRKGRKIDSYHDLNDERWKNRADTRHGRGEVQASWSNTRREHFRTH